MLQCQKEQAIISVHNPIMQTQQTAQQKPKATRIDGKFEEWVFGHGKGTY